MKISSVDLYCIASSDKFDMYVTYVDVRPETIAAVSWCATQVMSPSERIKLS